MPALLKVRALLERDDTEEFLALGVHQFVSSRDPDERDRFGLALYHEDYVDLGEPEFLTITVRPGDRLNDE